MDVNDQSYINPDEFEPEQRNESKLSGYKRVCAKLGLSMIIYFVCRSITGFIQVFFSNFTNSLGESIVSLINNSIALLFIYVIPLLATMLIFNSFKLYKGKYRELYQKPKRLARALGTFPASYGLGHGVAMLTLLVSHLITSNLGVSGYIEELFRPSTMEMPTNLISIIYLVFMLVVIAPLFEEFWCRGIMYDALKPYGTGIAIIISSVIFGLMHGSLYMFFYTTAYGLALGYIRYATGSLYTVTILHAIVNAIAAGALILSTLSEATYPESRLITTIFYIYAIAFLALLVVGVIVFLSKIPAMRKYKIENAWPEKNPWKKTARFFVSIPVIIMMILAANEFSNFILMRLFVF
ncbi:MAG: CPBP family intramembrane metalloprotease [Oscillospiraceae bacterium]|nr:CPBP family intramembrane metalloprotease [Oscillospiraceae bacterium]